MYKHTILSLILDALRHPISSFQTRFKGPYAWEVARHLEDDIRSWGGAGIDQGRDSLEKFHNSSRSGNPERNRI
jgi:hypothetical protein